ncbi:PilZ domain-containing protein [Steroidobacter cummioxidans]|uniref:PilZ domain-containing protein n=1 Tax=Steroidobacter cummioxidans TaxID=1803913 RepID=UPI00137A1DAF|nr:PilZ domain-containing protein [Steroidobacter cummioxidans]
MYEGLDTVILYEELAYEDVLPVAWRPLPEPFDPAIVGSFADRNLRVLQAVAALDEHGQIDKPDESSPHAADILRLEMKMNLLLDMVGALLIASRPRPKPGAVRFNALGGVFQGTSPFPPLGNQGVLEVYLRDCVADPLRLFGRIASVSPDGKVKVRFVPPGENISDLLEKLAFRKHRRQVAGVRQPKK